MNPGIRAVLFDLGGVIIDGPFEAFERYERANGLPKGFVRGLNATNHHDNAWARFERNEISFDEFCDAFELEAKAAGGAVDTRELFAMLGGSVRPEMVEAVRRCSARFSTAVLTNNFRVVDEPGKSRREELAEVLGLFDVVIESSKIGVRKPDPRFYMIACEALSVEPAEAVFLDDLGVNLKPAREMGMLTIKVRSTRSALAELEEVLGLSLG
ncbi:MAG TPA: HAD-IA family hydrolase [Acidimicrobiales bacterium]|nr:HAD-IA family hydrolase [Acidimicrobiales bacterium]